ncbi:hypothetical protein H7J77_07020 [Mycolicibacillus parakoreensis]|uniref:Uncharacterized protein n=1 Tax=Mycolicibacillus parakoreensis TaxID=1069221 RepID=A0ABY3U788_9MYCO|nr:hypothetical protein [Mycolicibacillus parakoreensis]MCV7315290.1 hypothetical protein [Mycolicibacillus parakoreensis]ULN53382.1 hypothetical protein MIU77_03265 [Mycolicibacillus parakoreensis]HLR99966.1 hypothetical protein [Mycolicibacillus parakoreensis]
MPRPAPWRVVTVGTALTGLGILGAAGAAAAPEATADPGIVASEGLHQDTTLHASWGSWGSWDSWASWSSWY